MRDGRDADSRKSQTSFLAVFSFSYGRKPGFSYGKTACKAHAVLVCHRFNEERYRKVHTMVYPEIGWCQAGRLGCQRGDCSAAWHRNASQLGDGGGECASANVEC